MVSRVKHFAQLHNVELYPARHTMADIYLFHTFLSGFGLFYSLQIVLLPIAFVIYTIVVLVTYKPFTKAQKIVFGLLPAVALVGNSIAMAAGTVMPG